MAPDRMAEIVDYLSRYPSGMAGELLAQVTRLSAENAELRRHLDRLVGPIVLGDWLMAHAAKHATGGADNAAGKEIKRPKP